MCNLYQWCIHKANKRKIYNYVFWILLTLALLIIDSSVSVDGSVFSLYSLRQETQQETIIDSHSIGTVDTCRRLPITKAVNGEIDALFDVLSDNGKGSADRITKWGDIIVDNSRFENTVSIAFFITMVLLFYMMLFSLKKILLFIQKNDGKKWNVVIGKPEAVLFYYRKDELYYE